MFKVNNKNTRARSVTSPGIFIFNFEHISYLFLVFLSLDFEKYMLAAWSLSIHHANIKKVR